MDKRYRAALFRDRLSEAMARKNMTKSALSRLARVDRSTIGQLLRDDLPRLPNAQLAADAAQALGVSTDWLLGLTNRPETPGDIVAAAMALSPAERMSADAQLMEWHHEAAGYKLRHVPATLPDILKTPEMLAWEYAAVRGSQDAGSLSTVSQDQFNWLASGQSDYEIAIPVHEIEACAAGTAYYKDADPGIRTAQLRVIAEHCDAMFPRLRVYLFNARTEFSAPITIFGPNLAVLYVGQCYLAFREIDRVQSLTRHFDWLVREAVVDERHVAGYIRSLL
ncbi:MAG: helix-turn-helix transcriptional regulator [Pseudomonadota bacterium]